MSGRGALLAGVAGLLCAPVVAAPAPSMETAFAPPAGPLILTRELRRAMAYGAEVVTRRRYEVRFVAEGQGYRVDGRLLSSEVEAPPALAALSEIERNRPDTGLFPLHIDARGAIVPVATAPGASTNAAALDATKTAIAGSRLDPAGKAAAQAIASTLVQRAAATGFTWPLDLFHPGADRSDAREVPLGDGATGRMTVTRTATRDPHGLLDRFERKVVTTIGGEARETVERWTLAPAQSAER